MKKTLQRLIQSVIVIGLLVGFVSCASIMSGTSQDVQITSTPSAAQVKIERSVATAMETAWEGATPATANLKRKHAYLMTVSLDGYQPVEMGLENGTNGWVWGNLLFGGLIGLVVDFANGAAKKIKPNEIHIDLVSVSTAGLYGKTTLYAVFQIKDDKGRLSVSPVPLVPDPVYSSPK